MSQNPDVYSHRRANLRNLIEQWGGPKQLADKLGYNNASFLVQMAGPNPSRDVTEKTARRVELALDLPAGWLDRRPGDTNGQTHVDTTLVGSVIRIVCQEADDIGVKLHPSKLADVVNLVYADAESNKGKVRLDFVSQLLRLLK